MAARPGFWFTPTDEELIDILAKKVDNLSVPVPGIPEVDISLETPATLSETFPRLGAKEWYFFTMPDRKYPNGKRPDRRCGGGFLKASQGDVDICSADGQVVGFRKKLIFCEGRRPNETNTDWKVDEYRLNRPLRIKTSADDMKLDWMLIRIYQSSYRKRRPRQSDPPALALVPVPAPAPAPINAPNSSCITKYNATNQEASSSSSNTEYNATNREASSSSSTTEYHAWQQHKIRKLTHFGSGINGSTNYGEGVPDNAFYYNSPPAPLSIGFNSPCCDYGVPAITNEPATQIVDCPVVPVLNTGTTASTPPQITSGCFVPVVIGYNTSFATNNADDATFQPAVEVPAEYNGVSFSNPVNTTTDEAGNRETTAVVADPAVPAATNNAIEQINFDNFDFSDINDTFDFQDIDFSADDFGIPFPDDNQH